jgi:hypothetical protein
MLVATPKWSKLSASQIFRPTGGATLDGSIVLARAQQALRKRRAALSNVRVRPLSRDGVQYLLTKHLAAARSQCPFLKNKRVTMHVLRGSTAMELLQFSVDRSVIAPWLGHERRLLKFPSRRFRCTTALAQGNCWCRDAVRV